MAQGPRYRSSCSAVAKTTSSSSTARCAMAATRSVATGSRRSTRSQTRSTNHSPELLCFFPDSLPAPIREIAKIKQHAAGTVPLVVVSKAAQETDIAEALLAGAQDLVSLGQTERLRSVAERELRSFRLERALNETLFSANQYKKQLKAFMAGSVDAIAYVQEGILVDANQAWADLLGHPSADALFGTPLMDLFDAASKAALKGRARRLQPRPVERRVDQGRRDDRHAARSCRSSCSLEATLRSTATRPSSSAFRAHASTRASRRSSSSKSCTRIPTTGFYHRRRFLEVLTDRLDSGGARGVRVLAYIRPDKFREIEEQIGPLASEDVLMQIAEQLRELTQPHDLYGRFGGQVFTLFLERGDAARRRSLGAERARAHRRPHLRERAQHVVGDLHDRARRGRAERRSGSTRCSPRRGARTSVGRDKAAIASCCSRRPTRARACSASTRSGCSRSKPRSWRTASGSRTCRSRA